MVQLALLALSATCAQLFPLELFSELPSLRLEHCCASRFNLAFAAPSLKSDLKLSNSAYGLGAGKHLLTAK